MKKTMIWFSILCALVMLTGGFAFGAAAEEAATVPTEEDFGELRIRIEGPDARMPMEISYEQFTNGRFKLEKLKPGKYTITEIYPEGLLEGYELQEDSVTTYTVTVEGDKEATAPLFNHYTPETQPESTEEPDSGPNPDTEEPTPEEPEEYVSVSVRKEWDDGNNAMGLRPASVTVTLSNGSTYVLFEGNGWSVTVDHLPALIDGKPADYTWKEQEVAGYLPAETLTNGSHTTLVNKLWMTPKTPEGKKKPKQAGRTWYVFDEYETPLGVEIMINHVGDCYE